MNMYMYMYIVIVYTYSHVHYILVMGAANVPFGGRYLLLTSAVRRRMNMPVRRLSSAARSAPSDWHSALAPGSRDATIGPS